MFIQPYSRDELSFAYCYRVYLRWQTHRKRPSTALAKLDCATLNDLASEYQIHVLEFASDTSDLLVEVSLVPTETISGCASKLKGRVSKWLREQLGLKEAANLLGVGYFACTVGKSTSREVEKYLSSQSEHHGYAARILPPVYVKKYSHDVTGVSPRHAVVMAQFHIVLATSGRRGMFGSGEGRRIAEEWLKIQDRLRVALIKVSFVPDHVHVALRVHPAVSPADTVIELMNAAQEVMKQELASAGLNRLWQPSAYVGSYGDLAGPQVRSYIENWKSSS
jgi:REP element-mobilizing transposase RayT